MEKEVVHESSKYSDESSENAMDMLGTSRLNNF